MSGYLNRKGDIVSVVSDAEFIGERYPFYNTAPLKEGAEPVMEDIPGMRKKKRPKIFYPSVSI